MEKKYFYIKKGSDLIHKVVVNTDETIFIDYHLIDLIMESVSKYNLEVFEDKLKDAINFYTDYTLGNYSGGYSENEKKAIQIINGIIKVLINPENYTEDNFDDRPFTLFEFLRILFSYIDTLLTEYKANRHHRENIKLVKRKLDY